jgi:hypothetical protein
MTRRALLLSAAGMATSCIRRHPATFVAFSLREAQRSYESGRLDGQTAGLGGITRLAGAVYDSKRGDCIVAGLAQPGADPIALEDFAAALDAILRVGDYPLVSIDRTPETATTGKQRVRVEGVRRDSPFASQLVAADILLKRAALQMSPAERIPIPSYYQMCLDSARKGNRKGHTASRLWFYAKSPSLLLRDRVAAIRELEIGVRTEVVAGDEGKRDEVSDQFAALFTQNLAALGAQFPEVHRLKNLFDCVAVAKGIQSFEGARLDYWTTQFPLRRVAIPVEYPLLRREERIERGVSAQVLELEGGIDMRVFARRLQEGDYTAFESAILESRPSASALSWPVPLQKWRFLPGDALPNMTPQPKLGMSIESNLKPLVIGTDPRGGVKAEVSVGSNSIRRIK